MKPMKIALFEALKDEILLMAKVDQEMRRKAGEAVEKGQDYWDASVDMRNTRRMKEIVSQIGWPTISKVGKEASHASWLLVQHADRDVPFQIFCLKLMKVWSLKEVDSVDIAYLTDRIRVNQGLNQVYGTQYRKRGSLEWPCPIENESEVNSRRKIMGLDTLQENISRMNSPRLEP